MNHENETSHTADFALLCSVSTEFEAELIKGHLGDAGIESNILSNLDSAKLMTIGEQAIAKIFVNNSDLDNARIILNSVDFDIEAENIDAQ